MCLWIKVIEAKDVPNPRKEQIVDPFVLLQLSSSIQSQRTRVIDRSQTPKWNQEFVFPLANLSTDVLKCTMIDRDVFDDDKDLAILNVYVSDIPKNDVLDDFFDMQTLYPFSDTPKLHLRMKLINGPQPVNQIMTPMMPNPQIMNANMMMMNQQQQQQPSGMEAIQNGGNMILGGMNMGNE